eukprot:scaffold6205_cov52-Attheya_sp.AAC.5
MVVAEVPLWVGHHTASSSSAGGGALLGAGSGAAKRGGTGAADADGDVPVLPNQQDAKQTQARSTLSLLTGMGGSARCAIYSVDMHPDDTRFATARGDGKVCLWNTRALGFVGGGNFRSAMATHVGIYPRLEGRGWCAATVTHVGIHCQLVLRPPMLMRHTTSKV